MCKYPVKKMMGVICAIVCALSVAVPCSATNVTTPEDITLELRMTNINDALCTFTVKGGKATATVDVTGKRGAEKCKIFLAIQEKRGSSWVTVDSWSATEEGRNALLTKSINTVAGKTYRAQTTVTVWLNQKAESKTITTAGKTA